MEEQNSPGQTSRRIVLETLLCLTGAPALQASIDTAVWQAFEAVEEGWIRERHRLLLQHAPGVADAAQLELDLRLADLARRRLQFFYLQQHRPVLLTGGVWQFTAFSLPEKDRDSLLASAPGYRAIEEKIRRLSFRLAQHPGHTEFRAAQTHLWKTPLYREAHRRYLLRMQQLQTQYSGAIPLARSTSRQNR